MSEPAIQWTGNLRDDCTAYVGELCLRAEKMGRNTWWWAVYNKRGRPGCDQLAASYETPPHHSTSGIQARTAAEAAAQRLAGKPGGGKSE